ncbi:MAG: translation initiation factor 2 [Bacillota bacterium]
MNFEIPDRETPTEKLLYQRISALEERLEQMRLSRRVLLRILEQSEEDKKNQLLRLEKENTKLQRQNCYFAKSLMAKNNEIMNLSASVSEK